MRHIYHFIGIGGVGMSALAEILIQKGERVSGSDTKESLVTQNLAKKGAKITYPQRSGVLTGDEIVIYSTAIKETNPEWVEAKEKHCRCLHRSELLEKLLSEKDAFIIAGAHGKTTTTSLLTHTLTLAGLDPSYVIGGFSPSLPTNGHNGVGDFFVAEGDESDGSFLRTTPRGAILTNVDYDHLDYWKSKEALEDAYKSFIAKIKDPKLFFYHGEDPLLSLWNLQGTPYGLSKDYPLHALGSTIFYKGEVAQDMVLQIPGKHNLLNALGVFGLAKELGVSTEMIRKSFATFQGVKRRMEWKGEVKGALIYDDYAHHPKEIVATLAALKDRIPHRRLVAVFQPHRYTRLHDFMDEFAEAFKDESCLILTEVYSAGEERVEGLVENLLAKLPKTTKYVVRTELTSFIKNFMERGDLVVTLGAGDITHVSTELSRG